MLTTAGTNIIITGGVEMRWAAQTAFAASVVAGFTTNGFAATTPQEAPPAAKEAAAPTLDGLIGKKLVSIDGSLIVLSGSEGGMSREIVASNGAVQRTTLRFINDRLGTVADARDTGKIIGVFRMSDADIEIQYADGGSETVLANAAGGISIEARSATSGSYCTAWFPEGHMFSLDDRKAALAQYASRLGLADGDDKKPQLLTRSGCASAPPVHAAEVRPKAEAIPIPSANPSPAEAAAHPAVLASAGIAAGKTAAAKTADAAALAKTAAPKAPAPKTSDIAAAAAGHAIDVRTSEVHPIDADVAADAKPPQVVASLDLNQGTVAPVQKGASSCLSVESDGSHWGFRNHCGYTVQFAYCLMGGAQLASCREGSVGGSVAGNGFGALVADESLKETDVAHDFRWVACQGGAGEVIPRLDQMEPPSGRCVR
jgi:hypothetical protein